MDIQAQLNRHPIHAALYQPILFAGLSRSILIAEITTLVAVVFSLGFRWTTLIFIVVFVAVVHPLLVWFTSKDPEMIDLFLRSRKLKDYYSPHPSPSAKVPSVYQSVTKA
jgi:type IV secretory pathway TrbD component